MTDQTNPLCEERFDELGDSDEQTQRVLAKHGRTLTEHTQQLDEHSRALAELRTEQKRHGDLLGALQTSIATLGVEVAAVKEQLKQMNGWQTKLIFVLVAALIVLAGVQKLGDLGIL
jgi:septal ring factor EnvC (AmiA/AmiB activator)